MQVLQPELMLLLLQKPVLLLEPVVQGLLLGEYLKALITGQGLPPDLDEQAKSSPYYRQYDQARVQGLARLAALPRSNFHDAFEKLP